jgi:hypothetical protein
LPVSCTRILSGACGEHYTTAFSFWQEFVRK